MIEVFDSNSTSPIRDPSLYRGVAKTARVQIVIATILGLSAFLLFSILRKKYPKIYVANFNQVNHNYLHSHSRQNLPKLPLSLFGWIPVVYKVNEDQVLEHAGLDAVVFLGFFKMCIKILTTCVILAYTILSPIRYKLTGKLDQDDPPDKHEDKARYDNNQHLLYLYVVFTYIFTGVVIHFLFKQTKKIIDIRQAYLGKQNSITDRTIKLSGIPPYLRDEIDLKRHIESLNLGEIERIVIVREWNDLNKLFKLRKRCLLKAENYWVRYFEINDIKNKNDMLSTNLHPNLRESINMNPSFVDEVDDETVSEEEYINNEGERLMRHSSIINQIADHIDEIDDSINNLPLLNDETHRRPKIWKKWYNTFSPKIDAINYYTEQLDIIDKEIKKARIREYPATSSAFITMKTVAEAQLIAQAVLDPKINHLTTTLAPAPHDVRWDNLCLTRRERNYRIGTVTFFIGLMSVLLVIPVSYLARFLNTKTISQIAPKLGDFLKKNEWAETLVTGVLPPYIFTLLNIIMPYFYIWITSKQGYTSHSDEELSTVSKNFFYTFVNLFLVFTLVGTASLTDTIKIAYQLAQSLRDLSLFYVDLIILQAIGIFPYKLLLLGNLLKFTFGSLLWCKTPRDYIKLYKPPVFNFGLQLPQPMLIFIIVIIYSVISTKILTAGLIYFIIGYFVFKYQLLYACVHPPHSTGKVWPLIFHRISVGVFILHIMMAATLSLQKAYYSVIALTPLPCIVIYCLYLFEKHYIPLSYFIALKSIETDGGAFHDDESFIESTPDNTRNDTFKTLDERREIDQTYDYPYLIESLDGPLIAVDNNEVLLVNNDGMTVRKLKTSVGDFY
ncbi:calcium permeable stress-gated cation channel 1 [[Candida] jaroonii]|uniref:Calcium permeable stress-gated cation channel 1 n=1 Tax=[Candida] jaroonii TaxID=467808 RepID=A0ACA9Y290_9ASCO|nr:calcium permeable stress-gated cation channel 1 [[Candida] jaroonii]